MKTIKAYLNILLMPLCMLLVYTSHSQQDPQFTQYMYNTMSVNPAYTGSRGHLSMLGMHRSQWVGINGAPESQVFTIDAPVGKKVGLGLVVVNDQLGPTNELFVDGNFAYTIPLDENDRKLSLGVKGGVRVFNLDFSKGSFEDPDMVFQDNINNKIFPTVGAGIYYHTDRGYVGLAIPNFFTQEHYDRLDQALATERLHYYAIAGKVYDATADIKLKPALFVKWVPGSPVIADLSLNAMIKETLTLGVAYRWDDSVSALLGLRIWQSLSLGYAYDMTTTDLSDYNYGTHEIFLRYEFISNEKRLKSPRFY